MVNSFGKDWFEPMILWIVIVMPTGAGKSTLFKFLRGILDTVRKTRYRKWKRYIEQRCSSRLGSRGGFNGKNGGYDG